MNTKHRILSITTVAMIFAVLGAMHVASQSVTWHILSSKTEPDGNVTIKEAASDGRTRTTQRFYFRNRPDAVQGERTFEYDEDGNKTSTVYSHWHGTGRQIAHGVEYYDSRGYTNKGKRWRYEEENGQIIDPRIKEEFNPRTKKWERTWGFEKVRVMHTPARFSDAREISYVLKRLGGFSVELREVASSEAYDSQHQGRLYYQRDGDNATATRIAEIVAPFEKVSTAPGTVSGSDLPEYSLWIAAKKPAHRFQGVFKNKFGKMYGVSIDGDRIKIATVHQDQNAKFVWSKEKSADDNFQTATLGTREIHTMVWSGCPQPETGKVISTGGVPAELIFSDDAQRFEIFVRNSSCVDGRQVLKEGWKKLEGVPFFADKFNRVSSEPVADPN